MTEWARMKKKEKIEIEIKVVRESLPETDRQTETENRKSNSEWR